MANAKTAAVPITAYKAFNADWTCRGFAYEIGQTYEHAGDILLCVSGFHACTVPFDCWHYYPGSMTFARVAMERVSGQHDTDSKIVAVKVTIEAALALPDWIKAQVAAVMELCRAAKKDTAAGMYSHAAATGMYRHAAATGDSGHAAATGYRGHAAATGYRGHAAATGDSGHAAATGDSGHAAATGDSGHAAATGDSGHAAATGDSGHAAATGDRGHAAATGDRGHAAATGDRGYAAATGDRGNAAATGDRGHAAATGKNSIAAALGYEGTAKAGAGGAIVLAFIAADGAIGAIRASKVGENGVEAGKNYRLDAAGNFIEVVEA
jgi:hypothetical protein